MEFSVPAAVSPGDTAWWRSGPPPRRASGSLFRSYAVPVRAVVRPPACRPVCGTSSRPEYGADRASLGVLCFPGGPIV